ncbi:MAG: glycine--tRNA ligase subunit beta, partial [Proteobacteria bacterium]|nr:glycine--tRNA ligase subunit beta [Pseudomonadota bacterium]
MAEFLLEIFSEEIPARMQEKAASDLARLVTAKLDEAKLAFDRVQSYVTARRLTLNIDGLALEQPDVSEERRGPRVDAPDQAIDGFLKSVGINRDQAEIREEKKGSFFYAVLNQKGRNTKDVIGEFLPDIIKNFPWPKSQRWGSGSLRWVRPIHSIMCILDGNVVEFYLDDNLKSGNVTRGHRFMAPAEFTVSNFKEYQQKLEKAYVVLDRDIRKESIRSQIKTLANNASLHMIEDEALIDEVTGLAEYPVVLIGQFDVVFLSLPHEAVTSAMRTHQKYFSLKDKQGNLSNKFIFVANMKTDDHGAKIIDGNERVLRARLSDTKFFWDNDLKSSLKDHIPALDGIVFHAKLGTVGDRVRRVTELSADIAGIIGADQKKAKQAAQLSKSDLVTGMVSECPELQGLMGKYFALAEGLDDEVAIAIADHYSPKGPNDTCPSDPVSIVLALAEKIDTLVGFFAIGEKPTGSKDPFALRRAALGIIRLILENNVRIDLYQPIIKSVELYKFSSDDFDQKDFSLEMLNFFWDRLKVYSKDKGLRHDIIGAGFDWDFVRLMANCHALQNFLSTDDGKSLLIGYKRAANILKAEEKKDGVFYQGKINVSLLNILEEQDIYHALINVEKDVAKAIKEENYQGAMGHLSSLRSPIDNFFDKVIVNS